MRGRCLSQPQSEHNEHVERLHSHGAEGATGSVDGAAFEVDKTWRGSEELWIVAPTHHAAGLDNGE